MYQSTGGKGLKKSIQEQEALNYGEKAHGRKTNHP